MALALGAATEVVVHREDRGLAMVLVVRAI